MTCFNFCNINKNKNIQIIIYIYILFMFHFDLLDFLCPIHLQKNVIPTYGFNYNCPEEIMFLYAFKELLQQGLF